MVGRNSRDSPGQLSADPVTRAGAYLIPAALARLEQLQRQYRGIPPRGRDPSPSGSPLSPSLRSPARPSQSGQLTSTKPNLGSPQVRKRSTSSFTRVGIDEDTSGHPRRKASRSTDFSGALRRPSSASPTGPVILPSRRQRGASDFVILWRRASVRWRGLRRVASWVS